MNSTETSNKSKNRVAIYVRVSTSHQVDRDSLPMQKQDLIAYSKLMLGTDDFVIFEDAGYSGKNTDRPKFQEMMSQIRNGLFSHLLVWKIDRISRNLLDFATMYQELKDLGVTFVSKNEQFDTSTAMGEAMLKIILVFAELERNMTSERVTATMISRAAGGLWNGGRIPYGYNYDYDTKEFSINKDEAEIVQLIHDKYEEFASMVSEARWLNENGYRTRYGNLWSPTSLHLILHSLFNAGSYQYNRLKEGDRQRPKNKSEWITVENHHDAIISQEQKDRVIALLNSNSRLKKSNMYKRGKYVHIFNGLLICGNCGKVMFGTSGPSTRKIQYSKYSCYTHRRSASISDCKWVSDPVLGEFVFNYLLNMLNAQRDFTSISSPMDLQNRLLFGNTFKEISYIDSDGLNDLFNVLSSGGVKSEIYGHDVKFKDTGNVKSEMSVLRIKKQKIERAIDRLMNLYIYSEDSMSEREYITQRSKLMESLSEINDQIGMQNSDGWDQTISDEVFINKASQFILAQKLADRRYISYKRLSLSVDREVLSSFLHSVIDSITMDAGKIRQIVFKNGLSHTFVYKQK